MANLHQKLTALLFILIIQICSGYLIVWRSNDYFNEVTYSGNISACGNLYSGFYPEAAKTDQCLTLFSKENCEGDKYKLVPGFYSHLFSFAYRAVSFEPCRQYSEPEAVFSHKGLHPNPALIRDPEDNYMNFHPLEKVSRSCQNLHWFFRIWGIDAVDTSKCILFFDGENCAGNQSEIPVGYTNTSTPDSPLRIRVKSYRTCEKNNQEEKHVKFYSKPNFTEIIDDVELQPGCNTKFYLNLNFVHSMETPACVKLFRTYDCSESFKEINPGSDVLSSPSNLIFPFNGEAIKSLMLCSEEPSEQNTILKYLEGIIEKVVNVFW